MERLNDVMSLESSSGAIASFETDMMENLTELKMTFTPIQEGSGDPSPENVRPITGWNGLTVYDGIEVCPITPYYNSTTTITLEGLTWTVYTNSVIEAEGSPTSFTGVRIGYVDVEDTDTLFLRFVGDLNNLTANSCAVYDKDGNIIGTIPDGYLSRTNGVDLSAYTGAKKVRIGVKRSNDNVYMHGKALCVVTKGAPYNDGVEIPVRFTRKNLLNPNGDWTAERTYRYIKFTDSDELCTMSFTLKDSTVDVSGVSIGFSLFAPTNTTEIGKGYRWCMERGSIKSTRPNTVYYPPDTVGQLCKYCVVYPSTQEAFDALFAAYDIQIERGNTTTAFEEFNDTIYGGYIDPVKGELVQTWGYRHFYGNEDWLVETSTASNSPYRASIRLESDNRTRYFSPISDKFTPCSVAYPPLGCASVNTLNRVIIATGDLSTKAEVNAWISEMGGFDVCWELATPITYHLAPVQIQTLIGKNNIFSTLNGTVSVKYLTHALGDITSSYDLEYSDPLESIVTTGTASIANNILADSKKNTELNSIICQESATGTIASFKTDMVADVTNAIFTFEPVQEGTGDPSPENIRPISGWDSVRVTRCGKNLLENNTAVEETVVTSGLSLIVHDDHTITINGTISAATMGVFNFSQEHRAANNASYLQYDAIKHLPNGSYIVSRENSSTLARLQSKELSSQAGTLPPSNGDRTLLHTNDNDPYVIDDTYKYNFMRLHLSAGTYDNLLIKPGVYLASETDLTYEPYHGDVYDIAFPDTFYGGYVDLVKGELVQTVGYIPNLGSLSWEKDTQSTNRWRCLDHANMFKISNRRTWCISSALVTKTNGEAYSVQWDNTCYIGGSDLSRIYVQINSPTTVDELKEVLSGISFAGELATPITYQLTPVQIQTLIGRNNIWSNLNGTATIGYKTHGFPVYDEVIKSPLELRRNAISNSCVHLTTVQTGNTEDSDYIAHFETKYDEKIKSLKVNFSPIQDGEGDPSPSNVRPIRGWDSINVTCAGKNLLRINDNYHRSNDSVSDGTVTFTKIRDDNNYTYGINVNGTLSNSNTFYNLNYQGFKHKYYTIKPGNYKYFGYTSDIAGRLYQFYDGETKDTRIKDILPSSDNNFNVSETLLYSFFRFQVYSTFENKNVDIMPMITLLLETDLDFEAFKPRFKTVSFNQSGKNLVPPLENWCNYSFDSQNTYRVDSSYISKSTYNIPVKENTTYTFSCSYIEEPNNTKSVSVFYFDENDKLISYINQTGNTVVTFTTPVNTAYIKISFRTFDLASNVQLEEGSTATAYEPFDNIVYGGYIDLISGELVSNIGRVDLGTLEWNMSSSGNRFSVPSIPNFKLASSYDEQLSGLWCSIYKMSSTTSNINMSDYQMLRSQATTYALVIRNSDYSSAADFKNAMNGVYLYYLLETPIIYQLTPQQIKTLKGVNNIWSDSNGTTEITYFKHG